jgi:hypothetical protein
VGEYLLKGEAFKPSENAYDWLGPSTYFWEANPTRGLEFAREAKGRPGCKISTPYVIGAVIDLGRCLDLSTASGIRMARRAYESLVNEKVGKKTLSPTTRPILCEGPLIALSFDAFIRS